jgi:hypothetical protein
MRRFFLAQLLLLVTLVVSATAAQAGSPPVTFTEVIKGETETFTDVVPCREDLGAYDITVTENGVFHVTAAGIDEATEELIAPYHVTGTFTGTVVAVPSDDTGPTFTGRFTQWFGENANLNSHNGTFTFSVRLRGSDGSVVRFNVVAHFSVSATGVTVEFEKPRCH